MSTPFKKGERVLVVMDDGAEVEAFVILASGNGRSLMLCFEATYAGFVGMLPVLDWDGHGEYFALGSDKPVTIKRPT